jgi:hypothetical protein
VGDVEPLLRAKTGVSEGNRRFRRNFEGKEAVFLDFTGIFEGGEIARKGVFRLADPLNWN